MPTSSAPRLRSGRLSLSSTLSDASAVTVATAISSAVQVSGSAIPVSVETASTSPCGPSG